jgi:glutamate---cysteine ligase / carboxylate-amine ligase
MSEFTVGIEEEYQLVDPAAGELRSSSRAVLDTDWSGEIRKELQESTIEVGTRVCATTTEARRELLRLRLQAAATAAAEELDIVAAGMHPFSDWRAHERTAGERYARMAERYGRLARDEHIFGMHVHVAPPPALDRMKLLNVVRCYTPHLLALSCSSPFHEGDDTGFASFRMVMWRRWPGSGLPPRLESDAEYRRYVDTVLGTGLLIDERSLYWTVRRHPEYPTLEFRMCDVCPSADDAIAIAACARTIVAAAAAGVLREDAPGQLSHAAIDALLADDAWRASRYGLAARFVAPGSGGTAVSARSAIARLLDTLQPVARDLGESDSLAGVHRILERGNGADRMRDVFAESGDMRTVVGWLARETLSGVGMDRRAVQRPAPSGAPPRIVRAAADLAAPAVANPAANPIAAVEPTVDGAVFQRKRTG